MLDRSLFAMILSSLACLALRGKKKSWDERERERAMFVGRYEWKRYGKKKSTWEGTMLLRDVLRVSFVYLVDKDDNKVEEA